MDKSASSTISEMGVISRFVRAVSSDPLDWEAYTEREVERSSVGGGGRAELPDELWRWTGLEIARGIRTRQISSREAVESCLARIEQVNTRLK